MLRCTSLTRMDCVDQAQVNCNTSLKFGNRPDKPQKTLLSRVQQYRDSPGTMLTNTRGLSLLIHGGPPQWPKKKPRQRDKKGEPTHLPGPKLRIQVFRTQLMQLHFAPLRSNLVFNKSFNFKYFFTRNIFIVTVLYIFIFFLNLWFQIPPG